MNPSPTCPQELKWTLASASPRRLELLRQVGIEPGVIPADVPELENGFSPREMALRNASRKGDAALEQVESGILLAADTIVVVDGEVLGKPRDESEARQMLDRLRGREHEVMTGYSLRWLELDLRAEEVEVTRVEMRTFTAAERDAYIATGQPLDKAGAYGIQGGAAAFVTAVVGCYFNVVGLPVARVLDQVDHWLSEHIRKAEQSREH